MNLELEQKMNQAFHFLASAIETSGHNKKPVLLHSFKVGMLLYQNNYSEEIILAGILHDVLEDTDISKEEIIKEFGKAIYHLIDSVSFDNTICDLKVQTEVLFQNCLNYGKSACVIKCADLYDNIDYVSFVKNIELKNKLIDKYHLFVAITNSVLKDEKIFQELLEKIKYLL